MKVVTMYATTTIIRFLHGAGGLLAFNSCAEQTTSLRRDPFGSVELPSVHATGAGLLSVDSVTVVCLYLTA